MNNVIELTPGEIEPFWPFAYFSDRDRDGSEESHVVYALSTTKLPAQSEIIISGKIDNSVVANSNGIISPRISLPERYGILVHLN